MAYTKDPPTYGRKPPCYGPAGGVGDISGDGRIASNDVSMMMAAWMGDITLSPAEAARADLNGDGTPADSADVVAIKSFFIGDVDTFPVCSKPGYTKDPPTYGRPPPCYGPAGGVGDIGGDGRIASNDVSAMIAAWMGDLTLSPAEAARADINGDGTPADSADVVAIKQFFIGDVDTFGVCGDSPVTGIDPVTTPDMRSLEPGTYNIVISKSGYDTVYAKITVSSTGTVLCNDVTGVPGCGSGFPRVIASGNNVKVHMAGASGTPTGKCGWVATQNTATISFISSMVLAYNNLENIGFTVGIGDISDGILMYNNIETPASRWGC